MGEEGEHPYAWRAHLFSNILKLFFSQVLGTDKVAAAT